MDDGFLSFEISMMLAALTENKDIKILVVRRRVKRTTGNILLGFWNRAHFLVDLGVCQIGGPSRLLYQPIISTQIARLGSQSVINKSRCLGLFSL